VIKVFLGIVKEGSPTGTQTGSSSVHDTIRTWTHTHTHTLPVSTKLLVAWKHFGTQSRMETHFNFTKTVCNLRNLSTYLTIEASVHEGICQILGVEVFTLSEQCP